MPKTTIASDGLAKYESAGFTYHKTLANLRGFTPPLDNVALSLVTGDPPTSASGALYGWSAAITTADNNTTIITPRPVVTPNSTQAGSPEGATVGSIGDINKDSTALAYYRKATGTSTNTGWVIIAGRWVRILGV